MGQQVTWRTQYAAMEFHFNTAFIQLIHPQGRCLETAGRSIIHVSPVNSIKLTFVFFLQITGVYGIKSGGDMQQGATAQIRIMARCSEDTAPERAARSPLTELL